MTLAFHLTVIRPEDFYQVITATEKPRPLIRLLLIRLAKTQLTGPSNSQPRASLLTKSAAATFLMTRKETLSHAKVTLNSSLIDSFVTHLKTRIDEKNSLASWTVSEKTRSPYKERPARRIAKRSMNTLPY